ncbi:hypothetical protein [Bradyrhizobium sp. JYMT SZCCT0180]|uniref:hypothetical protein n=1 Tax=Bradyrhizobium sp. JYMT SZCCT0180 TaxID=2807666 RepID=UPI001BA8CE78|nr:hypothetical protein [Bradyrhizobium sp. JYMT SZCCT0180]MBR1211108.1 hypothetical protein [Bradyrhizobium sp. JYMT SZCCT0180]
MLRVVAFNPAEGWSRDASEDIARELERRVASEGRELSDGLQDFIGPVRPEDRRAAGATAADLED